MDDDRKPGEEFARRQFAALRRAGLSSWTFEEFFAFCRPLAEQATHLSSRPIDEPATVKARRLADAISHALQVRTGKPLSEEARARILEIARRNIIQRNRNKLRLM